jgi:L,D-peptidoglycan transpeptidase YkuD (ErfK/YbiS/YcfS/YnhG family)
LSHASDHAPHRGQTAKTIEGATVIFTARADGAFDLAGRRLRCALGAAGVTPAAEKREGDGKSPLGVWPIPRVLFRPDRCARPVTALPVLALRAQDGWCDAPGDPNYNRLVELPYAASAERLWRDDELYDVVAVLGHNDAPAVPGLGSAIFLHLARADYAPTQGCVAIARADMLDLLAVAGADAAVAIVEA